MIAAAAIVIILIVGGTVFLLGFLRRVVRDEAQTESRLAARQGETLSYRVPAGVDVADLRVAANRAGFDSRVTSTDGHQSLQVLCSDSDRQRLRRALEDAHDSSYNGTILDLHPVIFEDEERG